MTLQTLPPEWVGILHEGGGPSEPPMLPPALPMVVDGMSTPPRSSPSCTPVAAPPLLASLTFRCGLVCWATSLCGLCCGGWREDVWMFPQERADTPLAPVSSSWPPPSFWAHDGKKISASSAPVLGFQSHILILLVMQGQTPFSWEFFTEGLRGDYRG